MRSLDPVPHTDVPARKEYLPPELVIYGSLRDLTLSGANDPPADSIIGGSVQTG